MFWWREFYHCFPDEYTLYRFDRLGTSYRKEYLLHFDQYITFAKINFDTGINSKIKQYQRFGALIGRDWIPVAASNLDAIRDFAQKHGKVLFKPVDSSLGKGIFSYDPSIDSEETLLRLLVMCSVKHYICEEFIIQHPVMAAFHPKSVNSIRILTFNNGHEIKVLAATLKLGLNDSEVDNYAHGGLGANIDPNTGTVNTPGIDHDGKPHYYHPETNVKIIGTTIPLFEDVLTIARDGAALVPEYTVIGWDIAILADSVCIIEMNNRPSVQIVQAFDNKPRGKEIKTFVKYNKEHVKNISKEEKRKYRNYY